MGKAFRTIDLPGTEKTDSREDDYTESVTNSTGIRVYDMDSASKRL